MSDGSRLRQSWYKALNDAETQFRHLVSSPANEWRRVPTSSSSSGSTTESSRKGKGRAVVSVPEPTDVVVHRYTARSTGAEIYRLILDVALPADGGGMVLEHWKSVLTTPELRQEWDPGVIEAHLVEQFDLHTRICKTNFGLGWPANPRDAVTISRAFSDANTVIDISTSLPRSADEPAFLRPSPPYVRSNVSLFAWCIQLATSTHRQSPSPSKLRITCFWQHDLRALWSSSSFTNQLSTMLVNLYTCVLKRGLRIARMVGWGDGICVERVRFQSDREAMCVEYSVVPEDGHHWEDTFGEGVDVLRAKREFKRLTRSVECVLPSLDGWDVQLSTRASSTEVENLPWSASLIRSSPQQTGNDTLLLRLTHSPLPEGDTHSILKVRLTIEISSPSSGVWLNGVPQAVLPPEDVRSPAFKDAKGWVLDMESIRTDFTTTSSVSVSTAETGTSTFVNRGGTRGGGERTPAAQKSILARVKRNYIYFSSLLQEPEAKWKRTTESRGVTITQLDSIDPTLVVYRAEAAFVGVGLWDLYSAIVTPGVRGYWDKTHEDAILLEDVNELTELWWVRGRGSWGFVGRDAVILKTTYKSPTAIHVFSFSADDPNLFPSIPPLDPTTSTIRTQIDLQGFAIEALSPNTTLLTLLEQSDPKGWMDKGSIPQVMVNTLAGIGEFVIRCGGPPVLTRLEGARIVGGGGQGQGQGQGGEGVGMRYEHERMCFRVEYRTPGHERVEYKHLGRGKKVRVKVRREKGKAEEEEEQDVESEEGSQLPTSTSTPSPTIECEIRCDLDSWAPSLDIIIDPPPQSISCLRRHRLSEEGGGLWITIVHDAVFVDGERVLVTVRKALGASFGVAGSGASSSNTNLPSTPTNPKESTPSLRIGGGGGGEKGVVMVNGTRIQVDQEEISEREVKSLMKRKRVKPLRIPLDQPAPVGGFVRRRREVFGGGVDSPTVSTPTSTSITTTGGAAAAGGITGWLAPSTSPLGRFFTFAVDQTIVGTQQAVAAFVPPSSVSFGGVGGGGTSSSEFGLETPMEYALDALAWTLDTHTASFPSSPSSSGTWTLISEKGGISVRRRNLLGGVGGRVSSPVIPIHKGEKVIEGVSADELASLLSASGCRAKWDDQLASSSAGVVPVSVKELTSYGAEAKMSFVVNRGGFPFRDRGFYVASVVGRARGGRRSTALTNATSGNGTGTGSLSTIYSVSASFNPDSASEFDKARYNPYDLPIGRVFLDAWVLETLDPYNSQENYAVPSTRCTRYVCVDYGGSMPAAVNVLMNLALLRTIGGLEAYIKSIAPLPVTRLPCPGFVLAERRRGEEDDGGDDEVFWRIRRRDDNRALVQTRFDPDERTYKSTFVVRYAPPSTSRSPTARSPAHSPAPQQTTPRPSRIVITSLDSSPNLDGALSPPPPPSSSSSATTAFSPTTPTPRERTLSSLSSNSSLRGRTSAPNSAFTVKGEVRHHHDLLVGELVIDSKLFPDGYTLTLKSTTRNRGSPIRIDSCFPESANDNVVVLPLAYTLHTMPSSPLHSLGASASLPTRHLLRLTLPTAQYEISTVLDPLTGETQHAPPKPKWLLDMEDSGGEALVQVVVKPRPRGGPNGKKGVVFVRVGEEEVEVPVVQEKESLTVLGREELLDDRFSKMSVLIRTSVQSEQDLKVPIAISDSLLKPESSTAVTTNIAAEDTSKGLRDSRETEESSSGSSSNSESSSVGDEKQQALADLAQTASSRGASKSGRLLGLLQSRFSSSGSDVRKQEAAAPAAAAVIPRGYVPISTTIIIALIAFLIGSLLRSLLSPADFVYYMTDTEAEANSSGGGWREIKRLFEIKYLYAGWDFQIAVVRRH